MNIAVVYDTNTPMTTGVYFDRAFQELGFNTRAYHHDNVADIPDIYDMYFICDSGPQYSIPKWTSGPSIYYAIDVHLDFENRFNMAKTATIPIMAQLTCGVQRAEDQGLKLMWIPLACDPEIHKDYQVERDLDVAFVGHLYEDDQWRQTIKSKLLEHGFTEDKIFVGEATKEEMGHIYSRAKIVINHSVRNNKQDVNMRVFEAMSSGALLLSQKLNNQDMEKIFPEGMYEEYVTDEQMFEKINTILKDYEGGYKKIAHKAKLFVRATHTYTQHIRGLLGAMLKYGTESQES